MFAFAETVKLRKMIFTHLKSTWYDKGIAKESDR